MINRGRRDIRRLTAASAISGTGDRAATTALPLAESEPVPCTAGR